MKKILLSLGVVMASFAFNAQTITNGDFEAAMTPIAQFVNTSSVQGWPCLNCSAETSTQYAGAQSLKLAVTNDPALNTATQWGDDIITGVATQSFRGTVANPANVALSFAYKYTKAGQDTAYIEVLILDTLLANVQGQPSDDKVLYFAYLEVGSSVANWTVQDFTMTPTGQTGNPNRLRITAMAATRGYYDTQTPTVGSILWLDNFKIGFAGLEENNESEVKVYPNPANDVLNVAINGTIETVSVISMDGKVVISENVNAANTAVNVAGLNAGVYVYEVKTATGSTVRNTFVKN